MLLTLMFTICAGLLLAFYLSFARAYVHFHAEQALYCAAEGRLKDICRAELAAGLKRALPWGALHLKQLRQNGQGAEIDLVWSLNDFRLKVRRALPDLSSSVWRR